MGNKCVYTAVVASIVCSCAMTAVLGAQAVAVESGVSTKAAVVSLTVRGMPLEAVLNQITRQAGLTAVYGDAVKRSNKRVTLDLERAPLGEAFVRALAGTGLHAVIMAGKVIFTTSGDTTRVVQGGISGRIIDAKTQQPLRGATVSIDVLATSVISGENGGFRIVNVTPGQHTIRVKMLGYIRTTKAIAVVEGQIATIDIALEPSVNALDQVIVTGTIAATTQREVSNAMTVITAKDIERLGIAKIEQLFRGDVPGLFVMNRGTGQLYDQIMMYARGSTSLTGGTTAIKTYVDGVELADPSLLSQIDPKSVERIEIIAGPQASTVYGSNAINGVMQIFTKRESSTARQVLLTGLSGLLQNDFRSTLAPQHDYAAQVTGTEGRWSYSAGGTWSYTGAWAPTSETTRIGGFGGARMRIGEVNADASFRLSSLKNPWNGNGESVTSAYQERGWYAPTAQGGRDAPFIYSVNGQTLGLTVTYTPTTWWSHEVGVGYDMAKTEQRQTEPNYSAFYVTAGGDSTLYFYQTANELRSLRYVTTIRVPVASIGALTVVSGLDGWQRSTGYLGGTVTTMTGSLTSTSWSVGRRPGHNRGGFVQGQFGLHDALFFTAGLRAEWNPNYGDEVQPNYAPRYGAAVTHDVETPFGLATIKLRGGYGRSTRPPTPGQKAARPSTNATRLSLYGPFDDFIGNDALGPETQQGSEGGVELYLGRRGTLILTRYNQTVDNLVISVRGADSVRSLQPLPSGVSSTNYSSIDADGFGYYRQAQYLNVGSIRNQGWELQSTMNAGPVTAKGTYSWTKSRVLGLVERYRAILEAASVQYRSGTMLTGMPEHTWALNLTYGNARTSVSLSVNGTGQIYRSNFAYDELYYTLLTSSIRLRENRARMTETRTAFSASSYNTADLLMTRRLHPRVEGLLQVLNLTDMYRNDQYLTYATLGRQSKLGFRLRI